MLTKEQQEQVDFGVGCIRFKERLRKQEASPDSSNRLKPVVSSGHEL